MTAAAQLVREALQDPELRDEILALVRTAIPKNDVVEPLIDARKAAEILGMTVPAVRAAAWRGSIPCRHVGRLLRFAPGELRRLVG